MVHRVVERFDPIKIVLFGSCARSEITRDSDVDLLVVMTNGTDQRRTAVEMRQVLAGIGAPKDIFVATPELLERLGDVVGYIYRPALREGRILYAKT